MEFSWTHSYSREVHLRAFSEFKALRGVNFPERPRRWPRGVSCLPCWDILKRPPVEILPNLSKYLQSWGPVASNTNADVDPYSDTEPGTKPESPTTIFAYREDLCSTLSPGGNKIRKLAHILPHVVYEWRDVTHLVVEGGVQSNCCRQVAMLAAKLGYKCVVALHQAAPSMDSHTYNTAGNVQLVKLLGAEVRWFDGKHPSDFARQARQLMAEIDAVEGQKAFFIPSGASDIIYGGHGHARWVFEMLEQEAEMRNSGKLVGSGRFDTIVVACASGSTLAGMVAGMRIAEINGYADPSHRRRIIGVDTTAKPIPKQKELVLHIARYTCLMMETVEQAVHLQDIEIDERWAAGGYGVCDALTAETIKTVARTEALILDPVYTGKAMTAVCEGVKSGELKGNILYVHTGGQSALPAYLGIEQ